MYVILKKPVKCINMCGNLRDILNVSTAVTLDYFVYYPVHRLNRVASLLRVKTFS